MLVRETVAKGMDRSGLLPNACPRCCLKLPRSVVVIVRRRWGEDRRIALFYYDGHQRVRQEQKVDILKASARTMC